jgi:hypothetical protein
MIAMAIAPMHAKTKALMTDGSIRISRKGLYSHCPIAEGPPTVPY